MQSENLPIYDVEELTIDEVLNLLGESRDELDPKNESSSLIELLQHCA